MISVFCKLKNSLLTAYLQNIYIHYLTPVLLCIKLKYFFGLPDIKHIYLPFRLQWPDLPSIPAFHQTSQGSQEIPNGVIKTTFAPWVPPLVQAPTTSRFYFAIDSLRPTASESADVPYTKSMCSSTLVCLCYLQLNQVNELVQVETYLRSEGVLVRYWYPIEMLERPPAGSRRTAANGLVSLDSSNIQIHR